MKNGYIIRGESVEKDTEGNITQIHCTYDPESRSGSGSEASLRKVKGTLHWVSVEHALPVEVRLYDRLFTEASPDTHKVITAYAEPSIKDAEIEEKFQFQRIGYFVVDRDSTSEKIVFNRTVPLRDSWAKLGE